MRTKKNQESVYLGRKGAKATKSGVASFVPKGDGMVSVTRELSGTILASSCMNVITSQSQYLMYANGGGKNKPRPPTVENK